MYRGTKVVIAGAVINFSLGVFYAWSVFAEGLILEYGWTQTEAALPYTVELLIFGFAMIFAGRFQDKVGPRRAAIICGLLSGLALILCYFILTPLSLTLFFGILFGISPAFGYAATTPTAMKWFPPKKRGLITGLVVMPMGAAPLIWSPLVKILLEKVGIRAAFALCGIFVLLSITVAAFVITVPESNLKKPAAPLRDPVFAGVNWARLLRNPTFICLWLIDGITAGVGLMFVGQLAQLSLLDYRITWGYLLVSLFSVTNTIGRVGGGFLCDRIGWLRNVRLALFLQAASILLLLVGRGNAALVITTLIMGACYGVLCAVFPIALERLFGLENFGFIYGMLSTAAGVAGFVGPLAAAALADYSGSYRAAFIVSLAAAATCFLALFILQRRIRASADFLGESGGGAGNSCSEQGQS